MDLEKIGKNIKHFRNLKGMTQKELASNISKTESSIRKYEKGLVDIPNKVLSEIAEALEVTNEQLLGIESNNGTFTEKMDFESWQKEYYSTTDTNTPVVVDGEVKDIDTLKIMYDLYSRLYNLYGFEERNGKSPLDFFYADKHLAPSMMQSVSSSILGQVFNSELAISKGKAAERNDPYLVTFLLSVSPPQSENYTEVYKHELGKENESLLYLKLKALEILTSISRLDNLVPVIGDGKILDFENTEGEQKLNISYNELQNIINKIMEIDFK